MGRTKMGFLSPGTLAERVRDIAYRAGFVRWKKRATEKGVRNAYHRLQPRRPSDPYLWPPSGVGALQHLFHRGHESRFIFSKVAPGKPNRMPRHLHKIGRFEEPK